MKVNVIVAVVLAAAAGLAQAQSFPGKQPIRIVVGFAAGGPSDIVARLLAKDLTERLGRSVIVENRPGATGTVGADLVAKAPADGHTLYLASQTTHAVAPYMYKTVGYDPVRDFTTITLAMHNPLLGVVHPSMKVHSVKDLIALAKARPGEINFATGGQGSSPHMSMELLKRMTKIDMMPIHYKGDGAAIPEVIGGQVHLMFASIAGWLPHARAGRVRGIAVTSLKRSNIAPEFPAVAETVPGFEVITWFGILGPAGMHKDVIARLNQELRRALATAAVKETATSLGMEIVGNSAEEYGAFLKSENVKWGSLVKELGLRAD